MSSHLLSNPHGDSMSFADAQARAAADHADCDSFLLVKCHDLFRSVENPGKEVSLRLRYRYRTIDCCQNVSCC
jgi:hypothetical protein